MRPRRRGGGTPEVQFTLKRDGGDKGPSERGRTALVFLSRTVEAMFRVNQRDGRDHGHPGTSPERGACDAGGPGPGGARRVRPFLGNTQSFTAEVRVSLRTSLFARILLFGTERSVFVARCGGGVPPNRQQLWLHEVTVLYTFLHLFAPQFWSSNVGSKR